MTPRITARFGEIDSVHSAPHTGVDIALPIGSSVYSPGSGVVSRIADYGDASLGKAVFVRTGAGYQYIFGHLSEVRVRPGERVHSGELLGLSGNTGNSTGPHLHVGAVDQTGHFVNPDHLGILGRVIAKSTESIRESAQHKVYDIILGILEGLRDLVVDLSYSIALIGGGLAIILHVAGYEKGKRWAGVLTVGYTLIKYVLG